jgi:hypothetical protein
MNTTAISPENIPLKYSTSTSPSSSTTSNSSQLYNHNSAGTYNFQQQQQHLHQQNINFTNSTTNPNSYYDNQSSSTDCYVNTMNDNYNQNIGVHDLLAFHAQYQQHHLQQSSNIENIDTFNRLHNNYQQNSSNNEYNETASSSNNEYTNSIYNKQFNSSTTPVVVTSSSTTSNYLSSNIDNIKVTIDANSPISTLDTSPSSALASSSPTPSSDNTSKFIT